MICFLIIWPLKLAKTMKVFQFFKKIFKIHDLCYRDTKTNQKHLICYINSLSKFWISNGIKFRAFVLDFYSFPLFLRARENWLRQKTFICRFISQIPALARLKPATRSFIWVSQMSIWLQLLVLSLTAFPRDSK